MGLDMYVFCLHKPDKTSEELSRLTEDELRDAGYAVVLESSIPPNFESVREMTVEVQTVAEFIDFQKLERDFLIPEDATLTMQKRGYPEITFEFVYEDEEGESYSAKVTEAELRKYKYHETITAYCFIRELIAYWRKEYGLSGAISRACDKPVENVGYYPMNEGMLKAVADHDPEAYQDIEPYIGDENGVIVYLEWY